MTTGRILIKFWRGNLYPQERLRERLQRARAQHGYRFADDEKNRDEELGHWFYGEDRELDAQIQRFGAARRAWYARCSRTIRARTSFAWARSATACVLALQRA